LSTFGDTMCGVIDMICVGEDIFLLCRNWNTDFEWEGGKNLLMGLGLSR